MKKIIYALPILLALITFSCEENFSPKAEFKEQYVLFGEVSPSSSLNFARIIILKSYDVSGLNPYDNKNNILIAKADVVLTSGRDQYVMPEDTVIRKPGMKDSIEIFYSNYNIRVLSGHKYTVTAKLPDGKVLTASTIIPEFPSCTFSYQPVLLNTEIARQKYGDSWKIEWDSDGDNLFFPNLSLVYYVWIEGDDGQWSWKYNELKIPLKYVNNTPVYPVAIWDSKLEYSFDSIDSTIAKISAGDPNKSNYKIGPIFFGLKAFDINFSKYYSSLNGYLDEYSIRIDESTYSNVIGGIGVFGSEQRSSDKFSIDSVYAAKFGYGVAD